MGSGVTYRFFLATGASTLLALALSACAPARPYPEQYAACFQRMERHAAELAPGFAALGYQPRVNLSLDDRMPDPYGLHAMSDVMGDALPSGRIRLRPSTLCGNDALARAVVAHEMAHVALRHRGTPSTGLVLEWEGDPPQEREANRLALAVLRNVGGYPPSERYLDCRLRDCSFGTPSNGAPSGRLPSSRAPAPAR